ncbi:GNAT family N-acetyltransferase [Jannaschia pohangensis]|uniref:Acetyltransferase (GNAT) family protein n=1 Tax=Jannaschia pohangensis TaxID=390807 RepID=A0A1I3GNC6_9RHOB|nr:GNAT family N-acetyltransferase [Jannaschia pohangensis]SFI24801.1 Acetyltransferase (GNAT) family protein [Jannaschia pohangensis]
MTPRPLTPLDAAELLPLVQGLAAHHGDVSGATVATLSRDLDDDWFWGVGVGAPLVGYALVQRHAKAQDGERGADLHHLFVDPRFRRQGHARRLIAAAEASARARGCSYMVIGAHVGNETAKSAYVAAGYAFNAPTFWGFRKAL